MASVILLLLKRCYAVNFIFPFSFSISDFRFEEKIIIKIILNNNFNNNSNSKFLKYNVSRLIVSLENNISKKISILYFLYLFFI